MCLPHVCVPISEQETCNTVPGDSIHTSYFNKKVRDSEGIFNFLVLVHQCQCQSPRSQHFIGAARTQKVFPEINGRAEPKMTEGVPFGILIYQGFSFCLMIAITVCIWQTQLGIWGEVLCIWGEIVLDLYNFLCFCPCCCPHICQPSLCLSFF